MKGTIDYVVKVKGGTYRHRYTGAVPMTNTVRRAIYLAQNHGRPLTARQQRQIRRMEVRP